MLSAMEMDIIVKLVIAAFLGSLIGLEREIHKKPGGLRTHALVCMGSTLFTVVSLGFSGPNVDSSRIAAGIVTGIGFLAAGMIIKTDAKKVYGFTTAAELWVLAAIGISVGIGFYAAAAVTTLVVLVILDPLKKFEGVFNKKKR
jgi:putative Mg2+ transporter-C (MgtC) family protein